MCECVKKIDEHLKTMNGRIAISIGITENMGLTSRLIVATEKIDTTKRKPAPLVVATFCPFCGVRNPDIE